MPITRRPGVAAVTVGLLLLTAACSSSTSSSSGTSSTGSTSSSGTGGISAAYVADKLGLARCLRAHGVPNYPDPNASGQEPPNSKQLIFSPQGQAAVGAQAPGEAELVRDVRCRYSADTAG